MKVLVSGATGYLGSRVAARLVAAGHPLLALVRPGSEGRLPAECRPIAGDLGDAVSVRRALPGCDALVHLAALVRMWVRDPREFDRINVEGQSTVLRAAEEAGVERIVYTSSIVALGPAGGEEEDEDRERTDLRFHTDHERSKWVADRTARDKAASGLPLIAVYPGVIYGPGSSTQGNLLERTLRDFAAGRLRFRLGRGDRRICYAYFEDVARGHLLALERGRPGSGYVLGGENATQDRLFELLQELTGVAPPRRTVPCWAGQAMGRLLSGAAWISGVPPAFPGGVAGAFRHEWAYSSARAERELGYRITPLSQGLQRTLETLGGSPAAAPRAAGS